MPDGVAAPVVGARVVVPLGSRVVTGIVVERRRVDRRANGERDDQADPRRCSTPSAFVPPEVVALARWTAEYYAAGVGDTIPALLPPMARGGRADAHKTMRVAAITAAGLEALDGDATVDARSSAKALRTARRRAGRDGHCRRWPRAGSQPMRSPASRRHGYISLRHDRVDRDPFAGPTSVSQDPVDGVRPGSDGADRRRPASGAAS